MTFEYEVTNIKNNQIGNILLFLKSDKNIRLLVFFSLVGGLVVTVLVSSILVDAAAYP